MVGTAARDVGILAEETTLDRDGLEERRRADLVMADFATAFSLEMDFERDSDITAGKKWPIGWTVAFALSVSAGLWALLAAFFYFV
jgi:hypothetical protein